MVTLTDRFLIDLLQLRESEQIRTFEALSTLCKDSHASSLRIRKMQGVPFWEIRATQELRIIANLEADQFVCQIVDHHDTAYRRAERTQPITDFRPPRTSTLADSILDGLADSVQMSRLTESQLFRYFGIDNEWADAARTFTDAEAVITSGIESSIGTTNAVRLMTFLDEQDNSAVPLLLRGNLLRTAMKQPVDWTSIEYLVLIAPRITRWSEEPTFGFFVDRLRSNKIKTLVITRSPQDDEHEQAINMLSGLRACELLLNDSIYAHIIAGLGSSASSFAILGAPIDEPQITEAGFFFASKSGHELVVKALANIGIQNLRTALATSVYEPMRNKK